MPKKTTKATGEISTMINKIQSDTEDAVKSMDSARTKTDNGIHLADEAGKALKQIVDIATELTLKVENITTATGDQSEVSRNIAHKIELINQASQDSREKVNSIATYLDDFTHLTESVNELNNQFMLAGKSNGSGKLLS